MTSVSIVSRSLRACCGRRICGGCSIAEMTLAGAPLYQVMQRDTRGQKAVNRHWFVSTHGGLGSSVCQSCPFLVLWVEERAEEARLFLWYLNVQIFVVVQGSRGKSTGLGVVDRWGRLCGVDTLCHDRHSLENVRDVSKYESQPAKWQQTL